MVKCAVVSEVESVFKESFNISEDLKRDLLEENRTMSSAYKRTWRLGESRHQQIGVM